MIINWDKVEFKKEKRFLSNMYKCNIIFDGDDDLKNRFKEFNFDGKLYKSSEHLYQAMKCEDPRWHEYIRSLDKPQETKKASRKLVKNKPLFKEIDSFVIRKDWYDINLRVMKLALYLKFTQNIDLKEKLINLDGYIEERNCWGDRFWGTVDGKGKNHLGKLLMKLRDELREREIQYGNRSIDF